MNILITSAGREISLIQAFRDALQAEGGGAVVVADISPAAPALYLADDRVIVPPSDDPNFVASLLRLCRAYPIHLIVPTRDEELPCLAEAKDAFAQIGTRVMVSDPEAIAICRDKKRFIDFCLARGHAVPRTYRLPEESGAIEFPVFVKPRFGKGTKNATRVEDAAQLAWLMERDPDLIVQELIEAPEYTIDTFADFEGRVLSVVPRHRIRVVAGESYVGKTTREPRLVAEACDLCEALGLVGQATLQCFDDGETIRFVEVNPRFGGGAPLSFAAGADTPRYLLQLCGGKTIAPRLGQFTENLYMFRYTQDVFVSEDDLCQRL